MTAIPPSRPHRPVEPNLPVPPKTVGGSEAAVSTPRGLHAKLESGPRPNASVPGRVAPGATGLGGVGPSTIRLPAPRELVTAFRDSFRQGAERWLGSVLPEAVRTALGPDGTRSFTTAALEGLPRAFVDGAAMAGVPEGARGDVALAVFAELKDRLVDLALGAGELPGRLMELGQSELATVGDRTREVLEKLLAGNGKGLRDFAANLVRGVTTGFARFASNVKDHLRDGLLGWLKDAMPDGVRLPEKFDAKELLGFAKDVLKLTGERVYGLLERRLPGPVEDALDWGKAKVEDLVRRGPAGLAKDFLGAMKRFAGKVFGGVERTGDWLGGKVAAAADRVEEGLAKAIPVAIDFLAGTIGLGGVPGKVEKVVGRVRGVVEKAAGAVEEEIGAVAEKLEEEVGALADEVEEEAGAAADAIGDAASQAADTLLGAFGIGS